MEAGPEMDAAIAVEIMGWTRHDKCDRCFLSPKHVYIDGIYNGDNWDGKECHPHICSPDGKKYYLCPCEGERRDSGPPPPAYSSDNGEAITALEHFAANNPGRTIELFLYTTSGERYCQLGEEGGAAWAETLSLAICLALLKEALPRGGLDKALIS